MTSEFASHAVTRAQRVMLLFVEIGYDERRRYEVGSKNEIPAVRTSLEINELVLHEISQHYDCCALPAPIKPIN